MDTFEYTKVTMERFFQHFPENDDLSLIILKGHLLIEELLNEAIKLKVKDPTQLRDAKLTFNQRLCLLRSFEELKIGSFDIHDAIKKLNILRNEIAHNLERQQLVNLTSNFLEIFEDSIADYGHADQATGERLKTAILLLHVSLNGYLTGQHVSQSKST
jgi:hypothetical protein